MGEGAKALITGGVESAEQQMLYPMDVVNGGIPVHSRALELEKKAGPKPTWDVRAPREDASHIRHSMKQFVGYSRTSSEAKNYALTGALTERATTPPGYLYNAQTGAPEYASTHYD